jgi:hypothetical protein
MTKPDLARRGHFYVTHPWSVTEATSKTGLAVFMPEGPGRKPGLGAPSYAERTFAPILFTQRLGRVFSEVGRPAWAGGIMLTLEKDDLPKPDKEADVLAER